MTDPIEVELKLEFDPSDRDRIVAAIPVDQSAARTVHLVTTYFDTPRRAVRRAGYSVRIRRQGSLRTQTVKADGAAAAGLFVRPEWEREVDSDIPAIDARDGPLAGLVGRAT
ncbi:MAG TPA: CYTH domain-containing protein, partial [Sphingomonas sp.]